MRAFGLYPDDVIARTPAGGVTPPSSLASSMVYGGLGFALVSAVAYSIWAFRLVTGAAALYSSVAAVYVVATGLVLGRLVAGSEATRRFAVLFGVAFILYALGWCAFWFGLKGKHHADLWGSMVGIAAMTWLILRAFNQRGDGLASFAVLFTFHTLGYYVGAELYDAIGGTGGRLAWGVVHGLGFGVGLGYVLFRAQVGRAASSRPNG
ncbi:MAG TPA: hypothetical protein VM029_03045 [Opitutaceae bacterium]|nr:hypothetical protein [Opitutaceae bacterium]